MSDREQYPLNVRWSAYAGLMFFGWLVKRELAANAQEWTSDEKEFIKGRCELGNVNLALGSLVFVLFWVGDLIASNRILKIAGIVLGMLILLIVCGCFMIREQQIFELPIDKLKKEERSQILKLFLPWRATKIWLESLASQKPIWRVKESELRWGLLFLVGCIDPLGYLRCGILGRWLIRVIAIYRGRDLMPQGWKRLGNQIFIQWIEEVWLYVKLFCVQGYKKHESLGTSYRKQQIDLLQTGKMSAVWRWGGVWIGILFLLCGIWMGARWKLFMILWILMRGYILQDKNQI